MVKHFVTQANQLHYCPVNQLGDRFLTPSLSFLLSGHMGQIKGAFPLFFFFKAAGLNHQAVANTEQVAGVSAELVQMKPERLSDHLC